MLEKLSGFVDDNSQNRMQDARQNEINRLLDQRKLLLDKKGKDDPEILAINKRLLELTGSRAANKFATETKSQVEGVLSGATDAHMNDLNNERRM